MPNNKLDNQPDNHPHNSNTSSKQQVTADNGGFVSNVVQLQVDGPITNSPITINLLNNDNNTPAKTNRTTIHNLPERNRFFTGRDEILEKLQEALLTNQSVAINQLSSTSPKQAISGLGGMGKTRTTLEFCYRHIDDYKHIFWVKSENETSFNNSYLELAKLLNLSLNSHPNTSTNAPLTVEQVIALVKDWLATNPYFSQTFVEKQQPYCFTRT